MKPADNNPTTDNDKFDELIVEWYERRDNGEAIEPAAFIAAHPEFGEQLEQYFADVEAIELMAGPSAAIDPSGTETTVANGLVAATESTAASMRAETDELTVADSSTQAGTYAGDPVTTASTGVLPEQFGRYRILKELGCGAMGAVYLAQDEQLQRKVALKVPKFPDGTNSELLERFYREARSAGNLRHHGICPVYDVGEIDGQHFITMAFIEGRTLRSLTESGRP